MVKYGRKTLIDNGMCLKENFFYEDFKFLEFSYNTNTKYVRHTTALKKGCKNVILNRIH